MAAHSYWRLRITTAGSSGWSAIAELKMFDSSGNSLCSGGTASASSTYGGNPGTYDPTKAFDGNPSTFWHSGANTVPQDLKYQFASPVDVAVFAITGGNPSSYWPITFDFQYSDDGSSWNTAVSYTVSAWDTNSPTRYFAVASPPAGQYCNWGIRSGGINSGNAFGAAELQFREIEGGANVATGGCPFASSTFGVYPPANAYDGNPATFWTANFEPLASLGYAFPRFRNIVQCVLTNRPDGLDGSPTSLTLEGSNDGGTTWTTVASFTAAPWTAAGQTQTFTVSAPPAASAQPILMIIC